MSLDPFWNRPDLRKLYEPFVGKSMLELGDKQDAGRTYKAYFESIGYRHVSVDLNGLNGALVLDLTKPLNLGTFDVVTNIGTSEHVSEGDYKGQAECWRNILGAMHADSVLICDTPRPGHWKGHGTWYPSMKFYSELARLNGMEIERLLEHEWRPGRPDRMVISARLILRAPREIFFMPEKHLYNDDKNCWM